MEATRCPILMLTRQGFRVCYGSGFRVQGARVQVSIGLKFLVLGSGFREFIGFSRVLFGFGVTWSTSHRFASWR